jgi:hypothetical protein
MELAAVNSPTTAFVAGLVTSLHCAGMCGPLACTLMPVREPRSDPHMVSTVYHLTRLLSYALLGGIAGGLGRMPLTWITASALRWVPWVMVIFFVGLALRWDRWLPRPAALGRFSLRLGHWMRGRSRVSAAAAVGFATPLLPCGPLYFILGLALLSGSAVRGVEFMLAFGLGTVPLLWLVQSQSAWLRSRLSPTGLNRFRLFLALATALIISWRLRATLGFAGPDPASLICF